MTILVSGASGILGYGILKSLKGHKLIGTTIYDFSIAPAFCNNVEKVLLTDSEYYMIHLYKLIESYNIDVIIPGIECDMYKWNNYRVILETKTIPILNNSELINLCSDKWLFYKQLVSLNPEYAIPTVLGSNFVPYDYPFLIKPINSYGSKGLVIITNKSEFKNFELTHNMVHYIVQPVIGNDNEEYTVSGFFDKDSNLLDYFPLRRKLLNGSTNEAIVEDRYFKDILINLAQTFKPIGATNFQFRFDENKPKLLEINPRISSATSIRTAFGYNEAQMSIDYFINGIKPKVVSKPIGSKAIRYIEDYIF